MQRKKILIGVLALVLVLGGAYMYSSGNLLQGKFSSIKAPVSSKADFSLSGPGGVGSPTISYNESTNYFEATVCGTNITDTKQTGLSFEANGVSKTVNFTPKTGCQTVSSGDLKSSYGIIESGRYTVKSTIDPTSAYTESNETNNSSSNEIDLSGNYYMYDSSDLPDLSIKGAEVEFSSALLIAEFCVDGTLKEYPSGSVSVSYTVEMAEDLYLDGTMIREAFSETVKEELSDDIFDVSDACKTVNLGASDWAYDLIEADLKLSMKIDIEKTTPESDENNNSYLGTTNTGR